MKKLLLLTGILTVFSLGFGAVGGTEGSASEKLQVKAEVIEKLELTTSEVNFGRIAQGQRKSASTPGAINTKGNANSRVTYSFNDGANEITLGSNGTLPVTLKNGDSTMGAELEFSMNGTTVSSQSIALNEQGENNITVKGNVTASPDQAIGSYAAEITVKVVYDQVG